MKAADKRRFKTRMAELLKGHGFTAVKRANADLAKQLGADFELRIEFQFLSYGAISPILSLINLPMEALRKRQPGTEHFGPGKVCFKFLSTIPGATEAIGELGDMIDPYETGQDNVEEVAQALASAIVEFGVPHIEKYAIPDASIELIQYMVSIPERRRNKQKIYRLDVATSFEEPILEALRKIYPDVNPEPRP